MTTYTFAQLEELWIRNGGDPGRAPLMAAIALAESAGRNDNNNYNDTNGRGGTQTSWGLWQISDGTHGMPVPNIDDPNVNAQQAVSKFRTQGLGAWGTYPSPALSILSQHGGTAPATGALPSGGSTGTAGGTAGAGGIQTTGSFSVLGDIANAFRSIGALVHGTAESLNFFFTLFEPGQMWRIGALAVAAGAGYGAVRLYVAPGSDERLPMIFLLTGVTVGGAYMAFRPWPQTPTGATIRPAPYVVDIFKGSPPSGPPPANNTGGIEAGLYALIGIWIISKTADIAQDAQSLLSPLGKIFSWVGGLFLASKSTGASSAQLDSLPKLPFGATQAATGTGTGTVLE